MGERKLTEKQRRFIDGYITTGNATEAARLAGYKGNNLDRVGHENLRKLEICISERNAVLESDRIADMSEVNRFWTAVMRDTGAKTQDRLKASEMRARAMGMFFDRVGLETPKNTDDVINAIDKLVANRRGKYDA